MNEQAAAQAVNFAILTAHRLGEPRVLELSSSRLRELRCGGKPGDFSGGPPWTYRGLRLCEVEGVGGRVLAWDRAREMEVVQPIRWPADQARA
ncbi:hypothetical protein LRS10_08430 [Phenylobacterium sp. J426]|uniref:hypothetical protein n=1 Tax=Phenylobacterium sp. J426 TaxID=2898439 RepID=UPI0021508625|nr:hypothetical protein [Phenylobacterium sp. J426]MCR5874183.1 hypothetical protein [Phenylobacterium sp. J426]